MADMKNLNDQRKGIDVTPAQSIVDAQRDLDSGKFQPTGSIIIFAKMDGTFHWDRRIAGLHNHEAIALLEAVKHDLLNRSR